MTTNTSEQADAQWMLAALAQAQAAGAAGEVPVGAVVVLDGHIIGTGRNAPIQTHDPTAHAEIAALRAAALHLGNYRLDDCELFVTLEPCTMCAGAMLHARVKRVVFGAPDPKTGVAGSVLNVFAQTGLNHQTQITGGVMAQACGDLLQHFFKRLRERQQANQWQAGRALRDDALRTPENRFADLPTLPGTSCYLNDLPSLSGWRLHYVELGQANTQPVGLCLHGPTAWSYAWRSQLALAAEKGTRLICPDLIGFGKSDKPKKAICHTPGWHAGVLLELIERLGLPQVNLIVAEDALPLARALQVLAPETISTIDLAQPDPLTRQARDAPYPDNGHRVGPRALSCLKIMPITNPSARDIR